MVLPVPPDDDGESDNNLVSDGERHERARQQAGSFWEDKRICKLFNSSDVESMLSSWIEKLIVAEFDESELEKMVNKSKVHPVEEKHVFDLQRKVMFL